MSFWDDVVDFGSGALDSVGEGVDVFVNTFAEESAKEQSSSGDTVNQSEPLVNADGTNVTQSSTTQTTPIVSNTTLLIGGGVLLAFVTVLILVKK